MLFLQSLKEEFLGNVKKAAQKFVIPYTTAVKWSLAEKKDESCFKKILKQKITEGLEYDSDY